VIVGFVLVIVGVVAIVMGSFRVKDLGFVAFLVGLVVIAVFAGIS
jgi:hypothetical protein